MKRLEVQVSGCCESCKRRSALEFDKTGAFAAFAAAFHVFTPDENADSRAETFLEPLTG